MRMHVHYRQIDGLRAGVAGAAGNVALVEYFGLVNVGVMHALAADVLKIFAPAAEIVHRALRAVCVKELHYVALLAQRVRRLYAAVRKLAAHYHQRLFVARGGAAIKLSVPAYFASIMRPLATRQYTKPSGSPALGIPTVLVFICFASFSE